MEIPTLSKFRAYAANIQCSVPENLSIPYAAVNGGDGLGRVFLPHICDVDAHTGLPWRRSCHWHRGISPVDDDLCNLAVLAKVLVLSQGVLLGDQIIKPGV